ncbi:MAG: SGNH/GDSL hydrolase family protein [Verrucomicrobiota bacterium]
MNKKTIILLLGFALTAPLQSGRTETKEGVRRENTEWCNMWVTSAQKNDKPRILMIGDSITNGYYNSASKALEDKAYGAKFTTSACVADPAFLVQLEGLLSQYSFAVIHFNNGLHGFTYSEEEYQKGYERALQYIKKKFPSAKLVLALSTPLKSTSDKNELNPRVDARNEIVRTLAKKYKAAINDLHSISKGHPEYYSDPYHYKKVAVELQAQQVAKVLAAAMTDE